MPKKARILLSGGGSGGHIIPNLAVASALRSKSPQLEIHYVSSRSKLDAKLLHSSKNLIVHRIFAGKWRRYWSWRNLIDPFLILMGGFQSLFILIRWRPTVVFSKGGYVTLPLVLGAFLLRIKIILHESDSRMGMTNKITSKLASTVCVSFPQLQKTNPHYLLTGNPVRSDILKGIKEEGYRVTGFKPGKPVLLVWGGSQGAQQINQLLELQLGQFTAHFQVIHISGGGPEKKMTANQNYVKFHYLDEDLKHVYAITDLVIGRAGANSLFELALLQKPNIIIPLSNSDQKSNAAHFQALGASLVYSTEDDLFDLTQKLWQNEALRNKMEKALKTLSHPEAAEKIADLILSL